MAIDISKLGKSECSAEIETTIGKLSLFFLSLKHSYILSNALMHADDESKPLQCIKILIALVCYPKDSLKDGKYKPEDRVLNLEDVNKLSEEEIKILAEVYIENNSSLYKSKKSWVELNDKGKEIHHSKYEGIKYPKEENESSIDYLYRLLKLEDERQREQMNGMTNLIPNLSSFSPNLQKAVVSNLVAGSAMTEAMKNIEPLQQSLRAMPSPNNYEFNPFSMRLHAERIKANRAPFDKLAERLDMLIDASSKSTEILAKGNVQQAEMYAENKSIIDETNRTQKEFIKEMKRSDVISNRYAITNLVFAGIVILLTIYGLFFK